MSRQADLQKIKDGFVQTQDILLALGDENRQSILVSLLEAGCDGMRVGQLTAQTHLSRPAVSHHLKILKEAQLVSIRKDGTKHYYAVQPNESFGIMQKTAAIIERLVEENEQND
ncbi:ArsR/SmtB family transcription factor [Pediococcus cellicola]|uniref:ArsR family transcriptional regulator n=1 Tax=Pediococcus cellicola TaxID=319652 RepID=A0A0R2IZC3_9LACO|nr:metalloregulator ArsR/SmtB family transcription factor [Pediococcus cellicola]KRN67383.1 ArsR family transcriptional regulator [Pediococcus cellicola]GEL15935.1 transcriptional regulator [Pediococcus cellicola]